MTIDLPVNIQQEILNWYSNNTIDFYAKSILNSGFKYKK